MTCRKTRSASASPSWRCAAASISPRDLEPGRLRPDPWSPSSRRSSPVHTAPMATRIGGVLSDRDRRAGQRRGPRIDPAHGRVAAVRDPDVADAGRHRGGMVADLDRVAGDLPGPGRYASPCHSMVAHPHGAVAHRELARTLADRDRLADDVRLLGSIFDTDLPPVFATHTPPAPVAIARRPRADLEGGITASVSGSTRETVSSPWFATQTQRLSKLTSEGSAPTGISIGAIP